MARVGLWMKNTFSGNKFYGIFLHIWISRKTLSIWCVLVYLLKYEDNDITWKRTISIKIIKRAILCELQGTTNIDSDKCDNDVSSVYSICSDCKQPHKNKILKHVKCCLLLRHRVPEERLRLSRICLCGCSQEVRHCY